MARYKIGHDYLSSRDGKQFGPWKAGETVEVDDADAAWVNRDSPGTLVRPGAGRPKAGKGPERDRSSTPPRNRGA